MDILSALVERNVIESADVDAIKQEAQKEGLTIEEVLLKRGIPSGNILGVKGETLNIPVRTIGEDKIPFEILKYIPEESASHYEFVPIAVVDGVLEVGIVDPDNIEALDALNFISSKINMPFKVFLISVNDFKNVLTMYKGLTGEVSQALSEFEIEQDADDVKEKEKEKGKSKDKKVLGSVDSAGGKSHIIEDAPVTKIVATMLGYAVEGRASDIHIENTGEKIKVRFRVDGELSTSLILPKKVHRAVVARIKILSAMRLDERRKPQDGRFSSTIKGKKIDFRVSTFPTNYGEKVVMRILDQESGFIKLDEIGFSKENLSIIKNSINKPYGMILIAGPTGSGKSTTLYSMLNEVDKEAKNVLSLEDPVEYNMDGVSQSQVRPEIGYTFATGLRTTLRQDPDVIMVGEIRDKETAQLAVQAALTGHLVLSTIHTNTSAGAIPRLIDMGVDPFLIAPTLVAVIAQRLVRKTCEGAEEEIPIDDSLRLMLENQFSDLPKEMQKKGSEIDALYEAKSIPECIDGTRGRMAVFEILEMSKDIEKIILTNPVESEIYKISRKNGMLTMKEDAIIKSSQKQVPFREINTLGGVLLEDEEGELDVEVEKENI